MIAQDIKRYKKNQETLSARYHKISGYILRYQEIFQEYFFYKMYLKIEFENKKWNYLKRKWNYLSNFQASDQKNFFTKCFSFKPKS